VESLPNGDGINDQWNIESLNTYPEADIRVFNRDGRIVYAGKGYTTPWNGTHNGHPVPAGTYYYVIDLKNSLPILSGWVFVVR
jgi:gliding motility-associated-like protein